MHFMPLNPQSHRRKIVLKLYYNFILHFSIEVLPLERCILNERISEEGIRVLRK